MRPYYLKLLDRDDICSSDKLQFGHRTRVGNSLGPEVKTSHGFLHIEQTNRTRLP